MSRVFSAILCLTTLISPAWAGVIKGRVLDPGGQPVASAKISSVGEIAGSGLPVKTDRFGKFSIRTASVSDIRVSAYAPGYVPLEEILHQGENTLRLEYAGQAWGTVVDEKGQPVSGAQVKLIGIRQPNGSVVNYLGEYKFKTTRDGRWTIPIVPTSGKATVLLDDPRFVRAWTEAFLGTDAVAAAPIVARPGGTIIGRVTREDGKLMPNLAVIARGPNGSCSWGKTDAKGLFTLRSMASGIYSIEANSRFPELLPGQVSAKAEAGKTTHSPDIVLAKGGIVDGIVVDKLTGTPRSDVYISAVAVGESEWHKPQISTYTDKTGHFKLGVVPGKVTLIPHNVLRSDHSVALMKRPEPASVLEIKKGETRKVRIELEHAVTFSGTAVDEAGKPAVGATLSIKMAFASKFARELGGATVDASGRFYIPNLVAGRGVLSTLFMSQTADWEIDTGHGMVTDLPITLPGPEPVKIVLHRIALQGVSGKAVTSDGVAIPGVVISAKIRTPATKERPYDIIRDDSSTTDINGRYMFSGIRPEETLLLSANKMGYRFVSGGEVKSADGRFTADDIILLPLNGHIDGVVLNADGSPAVGAIVAWPDGGTESRTEADNTGHFSLKMIPQGALTVVAAVGDESGSAKIDSPAGEAKINLTKTAPALPSDISRAYSILDAFLKQTEGRDLDSALELAPYDPDLAWKLADQITAEDTDQARAGIIASIAKANPSMAAKWAPAKLSSIKKPRMQLYAAASLGLAVADIDPKLAASLYQRAKGQLESRGNVNQRVTDFGTLAALAARLKNGEMDEMIQKAQSVNGYKDDFYPTVLLARLVAMGDPKRAAEIALTAERMYVGWAFRESIDEIVDRDLPGARYLLEQMALSGANSNMSNDYGQAAVEVVRKLRATDPAAALEIARGITDSRYQPLALTYAAEPLDKDAAAAIYQKAAITASQQNSEALHRLAFVAAGAYGKDPRTGLVTFSLAKSGLRTENMRNSEIAEYAYYYSEVNPAESRIMLEMEFARLKRSLDEERFLALSSVACAMAAIDLNRALQMADDMPVTGKSWYATKRQIAEYVAAPEAARRNVDFRDWEHGKFYNGAYYRPLSPSIWIWKD